MVSPFDMWCHRSLLHSSVSPGSIVRISRCFRCGHWTCSHQVLGTSLYHSIFEAFCHCIWTCPWWQRLGHYPDEWWQYLLSSSGFWLFPIAQLSVRNLGSPLVKSRKTLRRGQWWARKKAAMATPKQLAFFLAVVNFSSPSNVFVYLRRRYPVNVLRSLRNLLKCRTKRMSVKLDMLFRREYVENGVAPKWITTRVRKQRSTTHAKLRQLSCKTKSATERTFFMTSTPNKPENGKSLSMHSTNRWI